MAQDIKYDSNFQTNWNGVGDIGTVTGVDQIEQSIITSILKGPGLDLKSLVSNKIEEKRGAIEEAVRENPNTQSPIEVTVVEIDADNQLVKYGVQTNRVTTNVVAE